jgi:RNA polymerase sigma-32 factor
MDSHDNAVRAAWVGKALTVLTPRELQVIRERRLADEGMTLEALGKKLGVSKERVRQIEYHALKKLRAALLKEVADPVKAGLIDL